MGAGGFHGRVREGIGCGPPAKATRSSGPSQMRLSGVVWFWVCVLSVLFSLAAVLNLAIQNAVATMLSRTALATLGCRPMRYRDDALSRIALIWR